MGAGRKRKCQICGEYIEDNNESLPYKNGYCHKNCFNVVMKVVTTEKKKTIAKKSNTPVKPQHELKDGLTEEEFQQKKSLCDYIRSLTQKDLPVKTYKLIEDYRRKYKITFTQIEEDLKYYFEIQGHEVDGDAIGIVPYCHTEAQEYYRNLVVTQSSCEAHIPELSHMYLDKKVQTEIDLEVKKPQIDIASIGGD